jgi:endonuclease III
VKTSERKTKGRRLRQTLTALEKGLGRRRRRRPPDPLDTLLHAVLAGDGNDLLSAQILEKLRVEMVDWNELRVTSATDIEVLIRPLPDATEKALTIKRILQKLFTERHLLNLNFLKRCGDSKIEEQLDDFGGLSKAVKARVMLKCFDSNQLPVTTDIERMSKRLGLVEPDVPLDRLAEALDEILPTKRVFSFFHLVGEHAEAICLVKGPKCGACVVAYCCVYAKSGKE